MPKHRAPRRQFPAGYAFTIALVALIAVTPLIRQGANANAKKSPSKSALSTAAAPIAPTAVADSTRAPEPAPAPTADTANAPAAAPEPAPKPKPTSQADSSIDAYRGLGSWVDVWDEKALKNPAATVENMAANGVTTLFIETGNSKTRSAVMHRKQLSIFIREAHRRDMYVVGWYLPHFKSVSHDAARIEQALRFRTSDGQKFDSFALDIENDSVKKVSVRNRRLKELTKRIRGMVGPDYPLGAIIPSPLDSAGGYWRQIPYEMIAKNYDVFVPMSYYSFRVNGANRVKSRTIDDVRRLQSRPGCSKVPIHMIGGLAQKSSTSETRAFVQALRETRVVGGSLYAWSGTSRGDWQQLKPLAR